MLGEGGMGKARWVVQSSLIGPRFLLLHAERKIRLLVPANIILSYCIGHTALKITKNKLHLFFNFKGFNNQCKTIKAKTQLDTGI